MDRRDHGGGWARRAQRSGGRGLDGVARRGEWGDRGSARLVDGTGAKIGWAKLTEDAAGRLHVNVQVDGMTPGHHGIHLHAIGSCVAPAFTSAGGHHNPLGAQHGLDNPVGAHAGDLPNLDVNVVGRGRLQATTDRATLTPGSARLVGRATGRPSSSTRRRTTRSPIRPATAAPGSPAGSSRWVDERRLTWISAGSPSRRCTSSCPSATAPSTATRS